MTIGALAAEESDLGETVRELPEVLEAAQPALDNLNAAFPSTRAWALEMIPGVEETPATIEAGFPWVRQTRALLAPSELQGLVDDLQPAVDDFAEFVDGQVELLPVLDAVQPLPVRRGAAERRAGHPGRQPDHRDPELQGVLPVAHRARGRGPELHRQRRTTPASSRAAARTRSRPAPRTGRRRAALRQRHRAPAAARARRAARSRPTSRRPPATSSRVPDLNSAKTGPAWAADDPPDQEAGARCSPR